MGLLYYLDELARLLHLFNKAGREADRTFLLECWSGNGIYTVDRIGRGSFTIENLSVYLLGNIQPDVLKKFILESNTKVGVDGFYNRIQIMVAPNPLDYSVGTDRREDLLAIEEYKNIFNKLFLLQELSEKKTFSFDVKAQAIYDEWRKQHQELMQSKSLLMQAHLGKYRSLIPALALIYHLTENISADTPQILVGESSINKAIQLAAYLQSHADYIMESLHSGVLIAAHELREKIIWGNLRDGMTLRELKRKQWSKLTDDTVIREGLQILAEANWIRLNQKSVTGGQESISIELNPDNDEMQII